MKGDPLMLRFSKYEGGKIPAKLNPFHFALKASIAVSTASGVAGGSRRGQYL